MSEGKRSKAAKTAATYSYTFNGEPRVSAQRIVTGHDIRSREAGIPVEHGLWIARPSPEQEFRVDNSQRVDLGSERGPFDFYTAPRASTSDGKLST